MSTTCGFTNTHSLKKGCFYEDLLVVYVLKIGLMGLERKTDRFDVWRSVIWDLVRNIRSIEHAQLLS